MNKYLIPFISLFFLSGCLSVPEKRMDKKLLPLKKSRTYETQMDKKLLPLKKSTKIKKEHKKCNVYKKNMKHALSYILAEFENGYLKEKDVVGAKAQLFLIKNKSESIFSQNINEAELFYNVQYKKAKEKSCKVKQFQVSPLQKIENKIKKMDKGIKNSKLK